VEKRLAIIERLPALEITQGAETLTEAIMASGILPPTLFATPPTRCVGGRFRDRLFADQEL
jgi:hypothetical protein